MKLTKENFMLAVDAVENWDYSRKYIYLFCYICQGVVDFDLNTARYIYGRINPILLSPEEQGNEIRNILEEMWLIVLEEQKRNPKLIYIYSNYDQYSQVC